MPEMKKKILNIKYLLANGDVISTHTEVYFFLIKNENKIKKIANIFHHRT